MPASRVIRVDTLIEVTACNLPVGRITYQMSCLVATKAESLLSGRKTGSIPVEKTFPLI
jgi:hypothetical protein